MMNKKIKKLSIRRKWRLCTVAQGAKGKDSFDANQGCVGCESNLAQRLSDTQKNLMGTTLLKWTMAQSS